MRRPKNSHARVGAQARRRVVEADAGEGKEEDGAATEAVAEGAEGGGAEELRGGESGEKGTVPDGCDGLALARDLHDELGDDGHDDAEAERVDGDGDEDEIDGDGAWGRQGLGQRTIRAGVGRVLHGGGRDGDMEEGWSWAVTGGGGSL